jgi:hypothetical protein
VIGVLLWQIYEVLLAEAAVRFGAQRRNRDAILPAVAALIFIALIVVSA